MYPACAIDDQASSRTIRVWRNATMLPIVIVATASTARIGPVTASDGPRASTETYRIAITPPTLLAVDRYAAIGVGAPSYVAGAHAWNGTAAILNASPARISTTAARVSGRSRTARCDARIRIASHRSAARR